MRLLPPSALFRRGLGVEGVLAVDGHASLQESFDLTEVLELVGIAHADGFTGGAGAGGAADSVHVGLRLVRDLVVDDVGNVVYIYPPGGNVRPDEGLDLTRPEPFESALPLVLGAVAVDLRGGDPALCKGLGDSGSLVLGLGKDQDAEHAAVANELRQERRLVLPGKVHDGLVDRVHGNLLRCDGYSRRVLQQLLCELLDLRGHGRREHGGLPAVLRSLGDPTDVGNEAHVEHAVGFIDHQDFDRGQIDGSLTNEVEEAPRRRHQYGGPLP